MIRPRLFAGQLGRLSPPSQAVKMVLGYDPIFNVPDLDCTAAELEPATKTG